MSCTQNAIGFDSYLNELDNCSRVMVFNLFPGQQYLYPDTAKLWQEAAA
ncbi:hypothetical protein [Paenibacillus sp. OK060]|nr:hypothetical protein [Paenibacillus sp. OK060]